jgi:hypothetical protein
MRLSSLFAVATTALVASIATAQAQQNQVQVGVLECRGGQNVGFVVGSNTTLECLFQSQGRRPEPYIATVQRLGLDLGFTDQSALAWGVYAPTERFGRGALAGNYGGVGANASVGVGFGGNLLIGGSANSFALQPLSLQGQTGLNVTAGIANVELRPAMLQKPRGKKARRAYRRNR